MKIPSPIFSTVRTAPRPLARFKASLQQNRFRSAPFFLLVSGLLKKNGDADPVVRFSKSPWHHTLFNMSPSVNLNDGKKRLIH